MYSIETRMAKGQNYSALAGLYRQYELYYVIGINERARAADRDPAFSSRIREGLPGIREAWITSSLFQDLLARSPQAQDFSDQQRNVAQGAGADNDMRILAEKQHSEP